jgi:hypothetical protein
MYQLNVPIESIDNEVESKSMQELHFETKEQILEAISQFLDQNVIVEIKAKKYFS